MKHLHRKIKKDHLIHGRFSKANLVVFAIIFAAIGGYYLYSSFAASPVIYYVAENGSDTNSGDAEAPFRTINKALSLSSGGETIRISSGTYAPISIAKKFASTVTVEGSGANKPLVDGINATNHSVLSVLGATNLTIKNISFLGQSSVSDDVFHKAGSAYITLESNEFTGVNGGGNCVFIRSAANNITLKGNYIHGCATGIGGPNYEDKSGAYSVHHVNIFNNKLRNFSADAIQFADWDDVWFDHNDVMYAIDPNNVTHNDILQFTGNSHRVKITNNILAHSAHGQIMLVQGAFGPIDDVLIQNNLIYDAGAYAVQIQGSINTRFINNVVWKSGFGGLLVRQDGYGHIIPTDTVVMNNILYGFSIADGVGVAHDYNFIRNAVASSLKPHEKNGTDPGFVNAVGDDYRLVVSSPMIDAATSDFEATSTDEEGNPRVDVASVANTGTGTSSYYDIGALEYSLATSAPSTEPLDTILVYGAPPSTTSTNVTFRFSTTKTGVGFECKLDNGTYQACNSPQTYSNLSLGSHTFDVRAKNAAGQVDPTPAIDQWTITPPTTTPPPTPTPPTPPPVTTPKKGDLNNDSKIDLTDMSILLTHYNTNDTSCDLNNSGNVDITDLSILLSGYGK